MSGIMLATINNVQNTAAPTPAPAGIVTDSLFMQLDASDPSSYSGSGTTWYDLTANNNDATINGATYSATDGGLFDLNGSSNTISIPDNASLRLTTSAQRTIQVWVKIDALPGSGQQIPIVGKLSSGFGYDGYWAGLYNNTGVLRSVTNGTGVQRIVDSTSTVSINTWYLFTFMSQITATANTTKVYVNTTQYITTAHGSDSYNETNPLYLGYIGSGVGSLYLNGKIGACYFYTKGLSAAEILQNYNATKTRYGL